MPAKRRKFEEQAGGLRNQKPQTPSAMTPSKPLSWKEEAEVILLYSSQLALYGTPFYFMMGTYYVVTRGVSLTVFVVLLIMVCDLLVPSDWGRGLTKTARAFLDIRDILIKYYPVIVVNESASYDPGVNYILATHPHGVFPAHGIFATTWFYNAGWQIRAVCASVLFQIPILRRWVIVLSNAIPATKEAMISGMSGQNRTLVVHAVGGISEMFLGFDQEEVIVNRRRGWLKVAYQTGYHIIPTYGIGVNQIYTRVVKQGSFLQRWSRKLQISLTPFFGRLPHFLVPRRYPIVVMVGKPIPVEKKEAPTDEDVDRLLSVYREELRRLFRKGKLLHPDQAYWKNRKILFEGEPGHPLHLRKSLN